MGESTQAQAHDYTTCGDRAQPGKQLGQMDRMTMADGHRSSQRDGFCYRGNRRQYEQTLYVSIVAAFDAMRLEYQMIPHPHRIETIRFGALCAFQAIFYRSTLAKMRQQQAKF